MSTGGGGFASSRRIECSHHGCQHNRGRLKTCPARRACPHCNPDTYGTKICPPDYDRMLEVMKDLGYYRGPKIDPFKEMSYKELECIKEQIRKVLESGGEYKQKVSKSTMH
jgi:hypothetical protein